MPVFNEGRTALSLARLLFSPFSGHLCVFALSDNEFIYFVTELMAMWLNSPELFTCGKKKKKVSWIFTVFGFAFFWSCIWKFGACPSPSPLHLPLFTKSFFHHQELLLVKSTLCLLVAYFIFIQQKWAFIAWESTLNTVKPTTSCMINFFVFLKPEEYNFTGLSPVGQGMPVTGMCSFLSLINHSPAQRYKSRDKK